jgi:hypothetical protein
VGELGFHYIAVERALLVGSKRSSGSRARTVVAAGASIAAHVRSGLVQFVVGHWHAIVIGRPADRGSASRDQRFRSRSRARRNDPRSLEHEVSVSLGIVGLNGWGTHDKTLL